MGKTQRLELSIEGMTCAGCAVRIEKTLSKLDGVEATVNYATERATVAFAPSVAASELVAAVEAAGYRALLPGEEAGPGTSGAGRRLGLSAALSAPLVLLSMVPPLQFGNWEWAALALATPIVAWGGWPFHRAALLNARHGAATMDTLISIGTIAAFAWSAVVLLAGVEADMYFEVAGVITTLILLGRFLESRARRRSSEAIRALLELGAKEARVLRNGLEVVVPAEELVGGDRFVVRPGERIATDGIVEEGASAIDQSLLTGESLPVEVGPGADVAGGTFTLYLPDRYVEQAHAETGAELLREVTAGLTPATAALSHSPNLDELLLDALDPSLLVPSEVSDDRDSIEEGDRVVLIVEDDADFARTELEVARQRGFKGLVALRGDTGLALAREFRPDAIVLDMTLPVLDGWTVLDRLKRHPLTRHIPVHIVSAAEEAQPALLAGAAAFLQKPASQEALESIFGGIESFIDRDVRRLLVVDDDEAQRQAIVELVGGDGDVEILAVGSSEEALAALESEAPFDCMVLDLKLPKMTGFDLLEKIKTDERSHSLPVIVYTGKELTRREETKLKRYAETIVVKDARSPERLLDETSLFLHRVESKLPDSKRKMLEQLHNTDALFVGRKVLIVDDDVRNVFALTSALEANGMEVLFAENGREGIEALQSSGDVDLVLMDVMMPEMDGYETTQAIRKLPQFEKLPIIALTAKAMKGDRERSIAAGASDYITKPVDTDQLLSLMRVWLYQ